MSGHNHGCVVERQGRFFADTSGPVVPMYVPQAPLTKASVYMTLRYELEKAMFDGACAIREPPYREHSWLVRRASAQPPAFRRATATSFAGWVFDLSHASGLTQKSLARGKDVERQIREHRRFARMLTRRYPVDPELEVIFEDPLDDSASPLQASALTVGGRPLQCIPDRVLKNTKTGSVFVFENKSTPYSVPQQGWPNLKVQLWCYSWIDRWLNAPEVFLIGSIWVPEAGDWVQSRIIPRWKRSDQNFCNECAELFKLFGGVKNDFKCVRGRVR